LGTGRRRLHDRARDRHAADRHAPNRPRVRLCGTRSAGRVLRPRRWCRRRQDLPTRSDARLGRRTRDRRRHRRCAARTGRSSTVGADRHVEPLWDCRRVLRPGVDGYRPRAARCATARPGQRAESDERPARPGPHRPAFGGVIVGAIGTAWSFGIDAISFGVSAACLAMMRLRTPARGRRGTAVAEAKEGIDYVRSHRWLWASLLGAALANFFGIAPLGVLLPVLVRTDLHGSALGLGLVFAAGGAAGVLAS